MWPRPGSTDAPYDGASLPELYQEPGQEPGQEAGNSGVARAFTAALFFLCLLVQ